MTSWLKSRFEQFDAIFKEELFDSKLSPLSATFILQYRFIWGYFYNTWSIAKSRSQLLDNLILFSECKSLLESVKEVSLLLEAVKSEKHKAVKDFHREYLHTFEDIIKSFRGLGYFIPKGQTQKVLVLGLIKTLKTAIAGEFTSDSAQPIFDLYISNLFNVLSFVKDILSESKIQSLVHDDGRVSIILSSLIVPNDKTLSIVYDSDYHDVLIGPFTEPQAPNLTPIDFQPLKSILKNISISASKRPKQKLNLKNTVEQFLFVFDQFRDRVKKDFLMIHDADPAHFLETDWGPWLLQEGLYALVYPTYWSLNEIMDDFHSQIQSVPLEKQGTREFLQFLFSIVCYLDNFWIVFNDDKNGEIPKLYLSIIDSGNNIKIRNAEFIKLNSLITSSCNISYKLYGILKFYTVALSHIISSYGTLLIAYEPNKDFARDVKDLLRFVYSDLKTTFNTVTLKFFYWMKRSKERMNLFISLVESLLPKNDRKLPRYAVTPKNPKKDNIKCESIVDTNRADQSSHTAPVVQHQNSDKEEEESLNSPKTAEDSIQTLPPSDPTVTSDGKFFLIAYPQPEKKKIFKQPKTKSAKQIQIKSVQKPPVYDVGGFPFEDKTFCRNIRKRSFYYLLQAKDKRAFLLSSDHVETLCHCFNSHPTNDGGNLKWDQVKVLLIALGGSELKRGTAAQHRILSFKWPFAIKNFHAQELVVDDFSRKHLKDFIIRELEIAPHLFKKLQLGKPLNSIIPNDFKLISKYDVE